MIAGVLEQYITVTVETGHSLNNAAGGSCIQPAEFCHKASLSSSQPSHESFLVHLWAWVLNSRISQAGSRAWSVCSTARRPERFKQITSGRHHIVHFDPAGKQMLDSDGLAALRSADYIVSSIPPVAAKLYDPVLSAQHKLLQQVAINGNNNLCGLGYLSSTGVYGDWAGEWVEESSEPRTATARGLLRLEAEQAWAALAEQLQLHLTIFRLGGIYGPSRSVLSNLQYEVQPSSTGNGSRARRSRQRFTSRCHVADVVQAVLTDMQRRKRQHQLLDLPAADTAAGTVWESSRFVDIVNVVDDEPASRQEVEAYARQLLADTASPNAACTSVAAVMTKSAPTASVTAHSPPQQQQQGRWEPLEEKRVRNTKLKQLLQQEAQSQLVARTYREGLAMVSAGCLTPFEVADLDCLYGR